jgi:hypothetical protein
MKSEFKRVVTQASEEMLARWILKNLDWSGGNSDENGAFLTSILLEHRRQCAAPEAVPTQQAQPMPSDPVSWMLRDAGNGLVATPDGLLWRMVFRSKEDGWFLEPSTPQSVEPSKENNNVD